MIIDWSISIGNFLTIAAFIVGGITFVLSVRSNVEGLTSRMLAVEVKLEQLVSILVNQGRHEERMNAMDLRIQSQGQRLDDLARRFNFINNGVRDRAD